MARVEIASQAWGWLVDSQGTPQANTSATLKNLDGTNATTWSALTGGSSSTAALTSSVDGTLPRYIEDGTYTLTVGATTRRVEAAAATPGVTNVKAYAATGDGSTDDTAAVQDALDAAGATGGTVFFPVGTYSLDLLEIPSNVALHGVRGGSVLDFSGRATYGTETDPLIAGRGSRSATKALSGDHAVGATTLTFGSAHGLAVDDLILVSSSETWTGDASPNEHGELAVVLTVPTSTTVTLSNGLFDSYEAVNSAYVQKITPVENVTIDGLRIAGRGTPPAATAGDWGVRFEYGRNIHVRNCDFDGVDQCCVELLSVYGGAVENCTFTFGKTPDELNVQYGARAANASQYITVRGCHQTNGRHLFNCGHDYAHPGIQRMILCEGNSATGTWHAAVSTHNNAEHVRFVNNLATSCRYGVNLRSRHCSAVGNEIVDCGTGIVLTVKPEHLLIDGNDLVGCDAGIAMTSTLFESGGVYHEPQYLTITRNRMVSCGSGVSLSALDSTAVKRGLTIRDNIIQNVTSTRGVSILGPFAGMISNNQILTVTDDTNGDGIRCRGTNGLRIIDNVVDTTGAYGIRVLDIAFNASAGGGTAQGTNTLIARNRVSSYGTEGAIVDSSTVPTTNQIRDNDIVSGATSVAAAATTTLPVNADVVTVTGNTGITSITASYSGRRVTLIFSGTPTVTDGSNLKLAGNFVAAGTTNDVDTLSLVSDGTNWIETSRSTN